VPYLLTIPATMLARTDKAIGCSAPEFLVIVDDAAVASQEGSTKSFHLHPCHLGERTAPPASKICRDIQPSVQATLGSIAAMACINPRPTDRHY
jgi:hypothetical protein